MAEAACLNEECDREQWSLTKPVHMYKRGVTCPKCGTTRVETTADEAPHHAAQQAPQQPPQQPEAEMQVQGPGEAPSAPAPQQGGEAGLPAVSEEATLQTGVTMANLFSGMSSGNEQERAGATGELMKALGVGLAQYGQQHAQKKQADNERAKQTGALEKVQEYPECPDCGYSITTVPEGEFPCPACGTPLVGQ